MIDLITLHRRPAETTIPIETNASEIGFNQRVKRNSGMRAHPARLDARHRAARDNEFLRFIETASDFMINSGGSCRDN